MPKTRALDSYPWEAYWPLMKQAAETKEVVRIPCRSGLVKALTFRGELYAFRRACQREPLRAAALGINVPLMQEVIITIATEAGGEDLLIQHKDRTPLAQAALSALLANGLEPAQGLRQAMAKPEGVTQHFDVLTSLLEVQRQVDAGGGDDQPA